MAASGFILIVKGNPFGGEAYHSTMRTTHKERNERITEFLKILSLVGSSLLVMMDRGSCSKKNC